MVNDLFILAGDTWAWKDRKNCVKVLEFECIWNDMWDLGDNNTAILKTTISFQNTWVFLQVVSLLILSCVLWGMYSHFHFTYEKIIPRVSHLPQATEKPAPAAQDLGLRLSPLH